MVRGLSWYYTDNSFLLKMEPWFSAIFCGATAVKVFYDYLSLTVVPFLYLHNTLRILRISF